MTELEATIAAVLADHLGPLEQRLAAVELRLTAADYLLRTAAAGGHLGPAMAAGVAAAADLQTPPLLVSDYDYDGD